MPWKVRMVSLSLRVKHALSVKELSLHTRSQRLMASSWAFVDIGRIITTTFAQGRVWLVNWEVKSGRERERGRISGSEHRLLPGCGGDMMKDRKSVGGWRVTHQWTVEKAGAALGSWHFRPGELDSQWWEGDEVIKWLNENDASNPIPSHHISSQQMWMKMRWRETLMADDTRRDNGKKGQEERGRHGWRKGPKRLKTQRDVVMKTGAGRRLLFLMGNYREINARDAQNWDKNRNEAVERRPRVWLTQAHVECVQVEVCKVTAEEKKEEENNRKWEGNQHKRPGN